ncbi:hypothetical protein, partial [Neorhizobium galegae]|uniref:hypothetical protein n=1 Tax=Neorhizobium galegae TaxID=399 RepID=UPI0021049D18
MLEENDPIDLRKMLEEISVVGDRYRKMFAAPEVADAVKGIRAAAVQLSSFYDQARGALEPLLMSIQRMALREKTVELVTNAGWLPHITTPSALLALDMDTARVHQILSDFYFSEIDDVERQFMASVGCYDLDGQLTATFSEALQCHRHGCYRATVRLLFPEIERVDCLAFYGGDRNQQASLTKYAEKVGCLNL